MTLSDSEDPTPSCRDYNRRGSESQESRIAELQEQVAAVKFRRRVIKTGLVLMIAILGFPLLNGYYTVTEVEKSEHRQEQDRARDDQRLCGILGISVRAYRQEGTASELGLELWRKFEQAYSEYGCPELPGKIEPSIRPPQTPTPAPSGR